MMVSPITICLLQIENTDGCELGLRTKDGSWKRLLH